MSKFLMGMLGMVGLLAFMAAPAVAQEEAKEKVWNGKRWVWVEVAVKPVEEPKTILMELPRGEHKDGDILGMKTVGKHLEVAYYRRVPLLAPEVVKGHTCGMRVVTVLKHSEFRRFCKVDGVEKPCPGMNKAGECLAVGY